MKEKLIFFHMNQLGDLLFSLPVLYAARKRWPDKRLYSLVRPPLAGLIEASGLVDEVVPHPKTDIFTTFRFIDILRKEGFDDVVLFSESPESLLLSLAIGAVERYGFASASLNFLLTEAAPRSGVPSLINNRNLGISIGLKEIPFDYVGLIKVPRIESDRIDMWFKDEDVNPENIVVIAPGSSMRRQEKHWAKQKWIDLLNGLTEKGLCPVLIGAPAEVGELKAISDGMREPAGVFTSPNGLLPVAALISKSRFFVGIDSGAMHLSASLGVKCVALFGPTDPKQVGPQPLSKHKVIKKDKMEDITVEEVLEVCKETE